MMTADSHSTSGREKGGRKEGRKEGKKERIENSDFLFFTFSTVFLFRFLKRRGHLII